MRWRLAACAALLGALSLLGFSAWRLDLGPRMDRDASPASVGAHGTAVLDGTHAGATVAMRPAARETTAPAQEADRTRAPSGETSVPSARRITDPFAPSPAAAPQRVAALEIDTAARSASGVEPAHSRSLRSDQTASLTILDTCSVPIEMVWLDFEGAERSYGQVPAGAVRAQLTYQGHAWLLRTLDESGRPRELRRFTVQGGDEYVEACTEEDELFAATDLEAEQDREPAPHFCSTPSRTEVAMEIHNACGRAVEFFWVAFDCSLSTRGVVAADAVFHQRSYVGHVWQVRDAAGRVLDHFVLGTGVMRTRIECD